MTQSITLTASMRSNLASLKTIQGQMDTTQTRLSTGKKVNSAIDNASSYYQSRSLNNRAADLDNLLDSMGQGIQTIQAANEGIEAVTSYIEQAKSVANSAYSLDASADDYMTQVHNYQEQFNSIIDEINTLAQDASYQGVNLLTGSKLTVMFNETRTHYLDVQGKKIVDDMAGLGFTDATWGAGVSFGQANDGKYHQLSVTSAGATAGDLKSADGTSLTAADSNKYYTTADTLPSTGDKYVLSGGSWSVDNSATAGNFYRKASFEMADGTTADLYIKDGATSVSFTQNAGGTANETYARSGIASAATSINTTLGAVTKAVDYLRDYSSELGNNFSIIETRQNFTESLIDVLQTGSDNLVLADMNEESANYLALQTRQQLAINSLALASQSAQSVLKLF